jgi:hypothetical protein
MMSVWTFVLSKGSTLSRGATGNEYDYVQPMVHCVNPWVVNPELGVLSA